MGSTRPPCPKCGGFLVQDFDLLKDGDTVKVIKCCNCGWRLMPPPKCDKPFIEKLDKATARERDMDRDKYRRNYRKNCRNCGRYLSEKKDGLCHVCFKHRDNLEGIKWMIDNGLIGQGRGIGKMKAEDREKARDYLQP